MDTEQEKIIWYCTTFWNFKWKQKDKSQLLLRCNFTLNFPILDFPSAIALVESHELQSNFSCLWLPTKTKNFCFLPKNLDQKTKNLNLLKLLHYFQFSWSYLLKMLNLFLKIQFLEAFMRNFRKTATIWNIL